MAEAAVHGKPLTVISVLEPRHVPSMTTASVLEPPPDRDLEDARTHTEEAVATVAADTGAAPRTEIAVLVGHAGQALVSTAADADLIVVGSHGRSAIECMLLGSVGAFVVHHAHGSVAVIRSS
jgi:nucleotide-binding universal stress UspA family protein